ncbi:hypothetical protein C7293_26575 [filamentous cyanobacterium CCT1]|nr:hypothetical protein C7293_26575 [filamentous cyanobacterium CCT1]
MLYGSLAGIDRTIKILHALGYADPNDWSEPIPAPPGAAVSDTTRSLRLRSATGPEPRSSSEAEPQSLSGVEPRSSSEVEMPAVSGVESRLSSGAETWMAILTKTVLIE